MAPKNIQKIATRWWFIRHAPVPGSETYFYGNKNLPCDVSDTEVFEYLADLLPDNAIWVTSSLMRTEQTASAILQCKEKQQNQSVKIITEKRLDERDYGKWNGVEIQKMKQNSAWIEFWSNPAFNRPPKGETFAELLQRVNSVIEELSERYCGKQIIVVAHEGTIKAVLCHILNLKPNKVDVFKIYNCSVTSTVQLKTILPLNEEIQSSWKISMVNYFV